MDFVNSGLKLQISFDQIVNVDSTFFSENLLLINLLKNLHIKSFQQQLQDKQ